MMQTQIPSGLQALLQASQVLSQQASPTAPGPQGPQPTVAERINQQIKQVASPQPPSGIAGLEPNVRDIGQQAGVAGQIMAQKAQQQQQMAQNPQAVAQLAAQMIQNKGQSQGVAGLPTQMQFKSGGIIGYEGTEGSQVDVEEAKRRLVAAAKSGDQEAMALYAKQVAEAQQAGQKAQEQAEWQALVNKPLRPPPSPPTLAAAEQPAPQPAAAPTAPPVAPPVAASAAPRPAPVPPPARPAPSTAMKSGIASTIDTSSVPKVTTASIMEQANQIVPATAEKTIDEMKANEQERAKVKAGFADLNAEGIAALDKEQAARKQLMESKAERDQFNRVRAFFRDLGTRNNNYDTVQEGIFAREEADRLADLANSKAKIELKKAQQADKLGDFDRKTAAMEKYAELRNKESQFRTQAAQIAATTQSNNYSTDIGVIKTAAEIAQRDRATQAQLAAEKARLEATLEGNRNNREATQANMAMGKLTDAWKQYEKVKDNNKMGLMLDGEALKDPQAKKMHDDAVKAVNDAYQSIVVPAQTMYNALSAKVLGTDVAAPAAQPGAGAKPDFVYDAKTGKMVPNK